MIPISMSTHINVHQFHTFIVINAKYSVTQTRIGRKPILFFGNRDGNIICAVPKIRDFVHVLAAI